MLIYVLRQLHTAACLLVTVWTLKGVFVFDVLIKFVERKGSMWAKRTTIEVHMFEVQLIVSFIELS